MRNAEDMTESALAEYEQAIAALYAAVGKLARIGLPLGRLLTLAQAAYDKAHRAAVGAS